jgi:hypothetical protein
MGIDAEILVRIRGDKPSEAQLARWSWDLCAAIGAKHFFIADGIHPSMYQSANEAWLQSFREHPKHALWEEFDKKGDYDARRAVHEEIFADIGKAPQELRRAIELTNERYPLDGDSEVPKAHWQPGKAYIRDGDPILADSDEWFLEVNLWGRYYGIGYERGDILTYCAVAEWLEQNIPGCVVYYGGDSGGVCAEPFDADARAKLKAHLYSSEGRDYYMHDRRGSFGTPAPCGLCVPNENRFDRYGWGQNYSAVHCSGCGKSFESRDGGVTWAEREKDK